MPLEPIGESKPAHPTSSPDRPRALFEFVLTIEMSMAISAHLPQNVHQHIDIARRSPEAHRELDHDLASLDLWEDFVAFNAEALNTGQPLQLIHNAGSRGDFEVEPCIAMNELNRTHFGGAAKISAEVGDSRFQRCGCVCVCMFE